LLIAGIAFRGEQLAEAKLGVLSAALGAPLLSWIVFRTAEHMPDRTRIGRCSVARKRLSIWRFRWIRSETISAVLSTPLSRSSSTATSSAPTAAKRNP